MDSLAKSTIDELFELKGATRDAKAYAFLWASFRRTDVGPNPVRDALDCLIPFIAPHTNKLAGKQITADSIQSYLKENFGFDIPLYAIDQLISTLSQHGYVAYRHHLKAHYAVPHENKFDVVKSEIETEFDDIVARLQAHADLIGFPLNPPPSGSWGQAFIAFLRVRSERSGPHITKIKGALLDPSSAETSVVATFINKLHTQSPESFEKIVHIFMGVLIEDFIASITEIGTLDLQRPVTIFYDTAVLLRQLGCSGKSLRIATEELTRYLQDLGMEIRYLSGNEQEVSNILNTIIYIKDTGKELEGETAAAIADGEVTTTTLRMLQNSFPEQLARFNIFPAGNLEADAQRAAKHQIDEAGFSNYLLQEARRSGRAYGHQNRENDAGYLGAVMRLRAGRRTRDLADCGYVFVTNNKFLGYASRRFLTGERMLGYNNFPPIISLGQIATIAWLLKDQTRPPEKAGRELLTNCFAAIRPDAEWFRYFREGIEKVVADSIDDYSKQGTNAITVQAARRIAQEESFGSSAIVRQLNMAEILSRAEHEQQRIVDEQAALLEEERRRSAEQITQERKKTNAELAILTESAAKQRERDRELADAQRSDAVKAAVEEAKRELSAQIQEDRRIAAHRRAHTALISLKSFLLLILVCTLAYAFWLQNTESSASGVLWGFSGVLALVNVLGFADLLKIRFMEPIFDAAHKRLARLFGG